MDWGLDQAETQEIEKQADVHESLRSSFGVQDGLCDGLDA